MKFKIGNWAISNDGEVFQVKDIFRDGYTWYITSQKLEPRSLWDTGLYGDMYPIDSCAVWQPKEDEWCVFWDNDFTRYEVGRFIKSKNGVHYFDDGAINRENIAPIEFIQTLKDTK